MSANRNALNEIEVLNWIEPDPNPTKSYIKHTKWTKIHSKKQDSCSVLVEEPLENIREKKQRMKRQKCIDT